MARSTFRRTPLQNDIDFDDLNGGFFRYTKFGGLCDNRNDAVIDQETFADCKNVFVDTNELLTSRPPFKFLDNEAYIVKKWVFGEYTLQFHRVPIDADGNRVDSSADLEDISFLFILRCISHDTIDDINNGAYGALAWQIDASDLGWDNMPKIKPVQIEDKIYFWFAGVSFVCFNTAGRKSTEDESDDTLYPYFEDAMKYIYLPIYTLVINGIESELESLNYLTNTYRKRYLYSALSSVNFASLVGKHLSIGLNGPNTQNTSKHLYDIVANSANFDKMLIYPKCEIGGPYYTTMVKTPRANVYLRKSNETNLIQVSFDGKYYTSLPTLEYDIIGNPLLTDDGMYVVVFTSKRLAVCKLVANETTDFTSDFIFAWEFSYYNDNDTDIVVNKVAAAFSTIDNYAYVIGSEKSGNILVVSWNKGTEDTVRYVYSGDNVDSADHIAYSFIAPTIDWPDNTPMVALVSSTSGDVSICFNFFEDSYGKNSWPFANDTEIDGKLYEFLSRDADDALDMRFYNHTLTESINTVMLSVAYKATYRAEDGSLVTGDYLSSLEIVLRKELEIEEIKDMREFFGRKDGETIRYYDTPVVTVSDNDIFVGEGKESFVSPSYSLYTFDSINITNELIYTGNAASFLGARLAPAIIKKNDKIYFIFGGYGYYNEGQVAFLGTSYVYDVVTKNDTGYTTATEIDMDYAEMCSRGAIAVSSPGSNLMYIAGGENDVGDFDPNCIVVYDVTKNEKPMALSDVVLKSLNPLTGEKVGARTSMNGEYIIYTMIGGTPGEAITAEPAGGIYYFSAKTGNVIRYVTYTGIDNLEEYVWTFGNGRLILLPKVGGSSSDVILIDLPEVPDVSSQEIKRTVTPRYVGTTEYKFAPDTIQPDGQGRYFVFGRVSGGNGTSLYRMSLPDTPLADTIETKLAKRGGSEKIILSRTNNSLFLTESYLYYIDTDIEIVSEIDSNSIIPLYVDDAGVYYNIDGTIWTSDISSDTDNQLEIDEVINGEYDEEGNLEIDFSDNIPDYYASFNDNFLSFTDIDNGYNLLEVTSTRRNEEQLTEHQQDFLFYLPINSEERFSEKITNLHNIADTTLGVFTETSIYYISSVRLDSGLSYSKPVKSKIPLGVREGDDVVTALDGQVILFATKRGVASMTPQDFIASTERTLVYLSDAIQNRYEKFYNQSVKSASLIPNEFDTGYKCMIKICTYRYWLLFYRYMDNQILAYDTRYNAWWVWTTPYPIRELIITNRLEALLQIDFNPVDNSQIILPANKFPFMGIRYLWTDDEVDLDADVSGAFPTLTYEYEANESYYDDVIEGALNGDSELIYDNEFAGSRRQLSYASPTIEWHITSQRLHLGALNNYKLIQAIYMTAKGVDNMTATLSTKAYRDAYHPESSIVFQMRINDLRTFLKRMNLMHTQFFQFMLSNDTNQETQRHLKLDSISIRYEVKGVIR